MLIVLTITSFVAAIVFGTLVLHGRRTDRLRSDARVAALSMAIDGANVTPGSQLSAAHEMFEPQPHIAARGNPLIKAAVGVTMTVALIVAVAMATHDSAAPAPDDERTASTGFAPLELMAMRHMRDGDKLRVSGLVRNPQTGGDIDHAVAVVFAFARDGALVASNRAPLDVSRLRPGDASPFVVTIPAAVDIERYRVTFRTDRGVVQHVDRRVASAAPAAAHRM